MYSSKGSVVLGESVSYGEIISQSLRDNKIGLILLLGVCAHILSLFSPLSNKEVNNIFYLGVMLPLLFHVRLQDLIHFWSFYIVKLLVVFLGYTSIHMAITDDPSKLKYPVYILSLGLAFFYLLKQKLLTSRGCAYFILIVASCYAIVQLFYFWIIEANPYPYRPWFYGWQLSAPTYLTAYVSVAVCSSLLFFQGRLRSLVWFLLMGLVFVLCYLTQSRMGGVGLLAALFLFIPCILFDRQSSFNKGAAFFILLSFLAVFLLYQMGYFDHLADRGTSNRLVILKKVFEEWKSCGVLLGCGYDFAFSVMAGKVEVTTEHSTFSHHLLRSGLIGLSLLLCLLFLLSLIASKYRSPWLLGLAAGCGCLLVEGQSLLAQPRAITQFLFWIPFFMTILPVVISDLDSKVKKPHDSI